MEKAKPTSTLAKLYVSQQKYAYALAVYLYLQEKEERNYSVEIKEAIEAVMTDKWKEYPRMVKKALTKEDIKALKLIPGELLQFTQEALQDISNDFEGEGRVIEEDIEEELEDTGNAEAELVEDQKTEIADTLDPVPEIVEKIEEKIIEEDIDELEIENDEEIDIPNMGDEVFEEEDIVVPEIDKKEEDDELVPGVKEFENNYKEEVTMGLIDETQSLLGDDAEKAIENIISDKLVNTLKYLRGMNNEELRKLLSKKLSDGKMPEDFTLAELEEIID